MKYKIQYLLLKKRSPMFFQSISGSLHFEISAATKNDIYCI